MKVAVVLFNLGGPLHLADVRPFLENLFSDPAIIRLPALFRIPLAKFISKKREEEAKHIYQAIGGGSPLLANTEAQRKALEAALPQSENTQYRCFISMRYWHPFAHETGRLVADFAPDKIVFLPLYPQFSTTTTESSFRDFSDALKKVKVKAPVSTICCYPSDPGFIAAQAMLIREQYENLGRDMQMAGITKKPRLLFSSHGLPERVVKAGDPYQRQCEETAKALVAALNIPGLDWINCYQSRVGPLKWIEPYTDAEIERAGSEKTPVIIAPISFVSEHSETLYEIEQQYRELARDKGVPGFARVPAVGTHPDFIAGLARLAQGGQKQVVCTACRESRPAGCYLRPQNA